MAKIFSLNDPVHVINVHNVNRTNAFQSWLDEKFWRNWNENISEYRMGFEFCYIVLMACSNWFLKKILLLKQQSDFVRRKSMKFRKKTLKRKSHTEFQPIADEL